MKKTILFAALGALLIAGAAEAQLPPGRWWRRPEVIQRLNLSAEQQDRLETISRTAANDLIDLKGSVEKLNIALRGELDQAQLNRQAIQSVAARLNEARGRLFERELMLLVDMRGVLTDAQWNTMRRHLEQMREDRPMMDRPPMHRPRNPGRP